MIATMEGAALLDEADRLGKMVIESDAAEQYRTCKDRLRKDEVAQKIIQNFTRVKEKYAEVQRFGKYHPDFDQITSEVREVKRELDMNETVAAFKKAEEELETMLGELSQIIAYAVSPQIKVPTGNPFFDNRRCSGGCGSGGKCNCRAS